MKALRSLLIASLLTVATSAVAQDPSPYKFEFHGFVTGSLYMQDQVGGVNQSGQGLLFFAPSPANHMPTLPTAATGQKSGTFIGGDVRQSRYIFVLSGPKVFAGATPKAYFEGDLLGGQGGAPLIESWVWRIRAAYAQLTWDNAWFAAGQFSANTAFAQMPDSVSHIANPLSFGAGNYGWRMMGFRGAYIVPMDANKLTLTATVAGPKWGTDSNGATPAGVGLGQASGMPALELNANFEGKAGNFGYRVYGDVFYQTADLKGFGGAGAGATLADGSVKTSATSMAYELGGKFTFAPVYLAFNFYSGEGMGAWAGALLQQGGIKEIGYWVSLGANATKELSANVTYGASTPDEKDVRKWATPFGNTALKKENTLIAGQVKYMDGGYALAAEYITYSTKYAQGTWAQYQAGTNAAAIKSDMYQVILTAGYFF